MVTLTHSSIPTELLRLAQPPKQLFASSDTLDNLLLLPRIGIVGSRKFTTYGRTVTTKLAGELARKGVVVVSGLALGIDSIAQEACVQVRGRTIAVLPAGLDQIYPRSHTNLAKNIVTHNGLLLTEYPPGSKPYKTNFLARNRIIAGLSEGLLITEAAERSGSLNTARIALELGIPVFAVPGPITSPASEGANNLIKAGAIPVTAVEDIFTALNWQDTAAEIKDIQANTEEERVIIDLLQSGVADGHELLMQSRLDTAKFNQTLTMLEITGRLRPLGNNHWTLS